MNEQVTSWMNRLYMINRVDLDGVRRGQILINLCLLLTFLQILVIPLQLLSTDSLVSIAGSVIAIAVNIGCIWLTKRGSVGLVAWLVISFTAVSILFIPYDSYDSIAALYYMVLPIIIASMVLQPNYLWLVYFAIVAIEIWIFLNIPSLSFDNGNDRTRMISLLILPGMATVIGYIGSRVITSSLQMNIQ